MAVQEQVLKAELHCHIEGAAPPALVQKIAKREEIDVSSIIDARPVPLERLHHLPVGL